MTKKLSVFLLSFALILTASAGKIDRGFRQLEKKNYDRALQLFEESIEEGEDSPALFYGLAVLYSEKDFALKDPKEAYKNIRLAFDNYQSGGAENNPEMKDEHISLNDFKSLRASIETALLRLYLKENTVKELNLYIHSYPEAFNLKQAIAKRNNMAFEEAQNIGTAKAYSDFLEQYPQAEEAALAERQKNKLSYIELLEKEKELDKALKEKIDAENLALKERAEEQKSRITLLFSVVTIIFILLGFSIYSFIKIKKANVAIREQKDTIEEKNKQILDSIRYAKFIQDAILPKENTIKKYFTDGFIFFRPKDIVSGDFYWFAETEDKIMVAAVDCTGHGVPGAFMSMIGHTLLDQIVHIKGIHKPSDILFELRNQVIKSLNQRTGENYGRDGMDMALVAIGKKDLSLEYSGAYNPLYLVKNEKLEVVKADRQPIAIHFDKTDTPFTNHTMQLAKNDRIFLFSDGYADQFGGDRDKKYSYKRLRNDFVTIANLSGEEQKKVLTQNIDRWMGDQKPVDDMLIIGIKV